MLNEPVLNYHFPLEGGAAEGVWRRANRYHVWTGRQTPGEKNYELLELREGGLLRRPQRPRSMFRIAAGTPHRFVHLFAPWRVSDADTVYIRMEMEEATFHTLIVGMSRAVKQDHILWLCPSCNAEMRRESYDVAAGGMDGFWNFFGERIRAFNADEARRKCAGCGAIHPNCYGFDAASDDAREAKARADG